MKFKVNRKQIVQHPNITGFVFSTASNYYISFKF